MTRNSQTSSQNFLLPLMYNKSLALATMAAFEMSLNNSFTQALVF